jgi:hypothetical protein
MFVEHIFLAENSNSSTENKDVNVSFKGIPSESTSVLTPDTGTSPSSAETPPSKPPVAKFRKRTSTGNCSVVQSASEVDSSEGITSDVAPAVSCVNPGILNS